MQILKYTKKGSNQYELTLKDNTKLTLYTDLILKYDLLIKKKIDSNILEVITSDNLKLDCYYKALKYLKNIKCTKDIKNYLKDYPLSIREYTITRLTKEGYLNDNKYVEAYINTKISLSNDGYYKIYNSLKDKEINDNLIKAYLDSITADIWQTKIIKIVNTKLKSNTKYSSKALINKIKAYLHTLGYQEYLINRVMDNLVINNKDDNVKLQKEYTKLYLKYKNKYDKTKLNYILIGKLYQKGYNLEAIKELIKSN